MSGKMRPALLNQVLEELNIMERQPRPALGKAKRDCIRELVKEKLVVHQNAPLTLEELRGMDGEPVWCRSEHRPGGEGWYLVDGSAKEPHEFIAIGRERGIPCAGISSGYWLAYRRPPEQ